jgi:hypothetical protein
MLIKCPLFKPNILICVYFFVSLLVSFVWALKPYSDYTKTKSEDTTDFIAFMVGASVARDGKIKEIYNPDLQIKYQDAITAPYKMGGLLSFRALPVTAYLYIPFLYLKPVDAFYTQAIINMILLFVSIWVIKKTFRINAEVFWLYTSTIFFFISFRTSVLGGQLSILMLLVMCLSIYFVKRSRYFLSGILLGLLLLKINLVAIVPFLFIVAYLQNKKSIKNLVLGFLLSSFVILGINVLLYGPNLLTVYPRYLILTEDLGYGTALIRNSNFTSIMSLLTENRLYLFSGAIIISIFVAFLFLRLFRKIKNLDLLYATVPALGLFLNLHTMNCDLILLTLSIFLIGNYYFNKTKNSGIGLIKCFGVILLFSIATWIGIYDLQSTGLIIMLLFFYITLRSSISLNKKQV